MRVYRANFYRVLFAVRPDEKRTAKTFRCVFGPLGARQTPVSRSDVSGYFLFVITKMQIKLHWPPAFVCCEQLALNK
jgi:hypothetical protein